MIPIIKAQSEGSLRKYDRAEFTADASIHAAGCCLGLAGAAALLYVAFNSATRAESVSLILYLFGLLSMLGLSAAYNILPCTNATSTLRCLDHSAIYLMLAGP